MGSRETTSGEQSTETTIRNPASLGSAQYEKRGCPRVGHILDPRTGWSAQGLRSVTVVSDQAMVADAWATALFVLGAAEARRVAHDREDLSVVLIEPQENGSSLVWVEEKLRPRFKPETNHASTYTVRYF